MFMGKTIAGLLLIAGLTFSGCEKEVSLRSQYEFSGFVGNDIVDSWYAEETSSSGPKKEIRNHMFVTKRDGTVIKFYNIYDPNHSWDESKLDAAEVYPFQGGGRILTPFDSTGEFESLSKQYEFFLREIREGRGRKIFTISS